MRAEAVNKRKGKANAGPPKAGSAASKEPAPLPTGANPVDVRIVPRPAAELQIWRYPYKHGVFNKAGTKGEEAAADSAADSLTTVSVWLSAPPLFR
eukprot:SAG31_NODE_5178_length_2697_cov_3.029638_4_plen_96_part_00